MKKFSLGIIGLLVFLVLFSGCASEKTGNTTNQNNTNNQPENANQTKNTTRNHYDDESISFDYPDNWSISKEKISSSLVVTVEKDRNNTFSVFKEDLGSRDFKERLIEWRDNINRNGNIYYEGTVTIDGVKAYDIEATYQTEGGIYNTRGIALKKDRTAYFIIFIFNRSLLDYKGEMDLVMNSFHVK